MKGRLTSAAGPYEGLAAADAVLIVTDHAGITLMGFIADTLDKV